MVPWFSITVALFLFGLSVSTVALFFALRKAQASIDSLQRALKLVNCCIYVAHKTGKLPATLSAKHH